MTEDETPISEEQPSIFLEDEPALTAEQATLTEDETPISEEQPSIFLEDEPALTAEQATLTEDETPISEEQPSIFLEDEPALTAEQAALTEDQTPLAEEEAIFLPEDNRLSTEQETSLPEEPPALPTQQLPLTLIEEEAETSQDETETPVILPLHQSPLTLVSEEEETVENESATPEFTTTDPPTADWLELLQDKVGDTLEELRETVSEKTEQVGDWMATIKDKLDGDDDERTLQPPPLPNAQTEAAEEENYLESGFVSEATAEAYARQEEFVKAINIYRQLMLQFPEKSSYFAQKISELES